MKGKKFDGGKLRWWLLPLKALEGVVRVLQFGADRYGENNWMKLDNAERRYLEAMMRHVAEYQAGEEIDKDSGQHHLDHAMCNLLFIRWHQQNRRKI